MKTPYRWIAVILATGLMAAASSSLAGDCCKQTAKNVRVGKACEKCVTEQCCKDTAKRIAEKGKASACEKCAAKTRGTHQKKK